LLIGYMDNTVFNARTAILPPQKTHDGAYCLFRKEIFPIITKSLRQISRDDNSDFFNRYAVGSWIHTHPGLTVFFSKTDVSTFKYLTSLSPSMTAVVLDPLNNQIMALNGEKGDKYGFTGIPITIKKFDSPPFELEHHLLSRFQTSVESPESAAEIGSDDKINVFIPVTDSLLRRKSIDMKLDYCISRLREISYKPIYSETMGHYIPQISKYIRKISHDIENTIFPEFYQISHKGFMYGNYENGVLVVKRLYWRKIRLAKVEVLHANILSLELEFKSIKRKKHYFVLYVEDLQIFQDVLFEYLDKVTIEVIRLNKSTVRKNTAAGSENLTDENLKNKI